MPVTGSSFLEAEVHLRLCRAAFRGERLLARAIWRSSPSRLSETTTYREPFPEVRSPREYASPGTGSRVLPPLVRIATWYPEGDS